MAGPEGVSQSSLYFKANSLGVKTSVCSLPSTVDPNMQHFRVPSSQSLGTAQIVS